MDFKKILEDMARAIVDTPDQVNVEEEREGEDDITLILTVAPDDTGKVIGRHGRIAKAIRTVMRAAAAGSGKRVTVEIR
ncbi:MAG: KH domain-containing protein [Clostridia bacterium]|nr:KH domain-containing protein [Clostridia bacterium]MBR6795526.1 KH domain-containing protein [Clostridia bacterium]